MNPDLDTLVTALYVTVDDLLVAHPGWAPPRPAVGFAPKLSGAELLTLAALQTPLGFDSEARFVRYAKEHLTPWFPYLPGRSGYHKRLRRSGQLMQHVLGALARDDPSSKTTLNRSILCDTPLTGSASRSGPTAPINYGHSPRSGRHSPAFHAPTPSVDPG